MGGSVKALVITLGAALLLYGASFFSRTDDARWMNHDHTSAPQATQRRSSPPSNPDSAVPQGLERPDPLVTSSLSTSVPASADSRAGPAEMPKCCSQTRSRRPRHSAPAPSNQAPAPQPETAEVQMAPEPGAEPIQFSLADRGN